MLAFTDNAKYVKRGSDLVFCYDPGWEDDVRDINESKEGARFKYADALIMLAVSLRTATGTPWRQLSGMVDTMLEGHDSPEHTTLWKRANLLDVDIDCGMTTIYDPDKSITMIADSTGLKQCNRGEWIRKKWKVRRGFVKLHMLADADTKKILAIVVTDDRTGDSPVLGDLLGTIVESEKEPEKEPEKDKGNENRMELIRGKSGALKEPFPSTESPPTNMLADGISPLATLCDTPQTWGASLLADGAYASRENTQLCSDLGIRTMIPIRTDCTARGKGTGDAWGIAVREQLGGDQSARVDKLDVQEREENKRYWKSTVGYGRRWIIEIIISAFKRMFGDHLHARKWENMVQEIKLRVAQYNRWQEAAAV